MNPRFSITSRLAAEHRPALEELLFFNARQDLVRHRIEATIERYGMPELYEKDGMLRIRLAGTAEPQVLFAVAGQPQPRPVGMALFVREGEERFVIVHIGVAADFAAEGPHADANLFFHLLQAIRGAARRTRGVRFVDLFYGHGRARHIRV